MRALVVGSMALSLLLGAHLRREGEPDGSAPPRRDDASLRESLEAIQRETGIPGIAAAVVGREGLIATAAAGRRRMDEPAPLLSSDAFHLGSDTKAMTAFVVARMVERGVLRWDMTLAEAFPDWARSMSPAYRSVVLTDVLRHRGGMPALTHASEMGLLRGIDLNAPVAAQRAVFARRVLERAPAVAPRQAFLYSNAGYMLVGAILERRTHKPWEQLIREELFGPLGMRTCGFGPPASGSQRGQPFGHEVGLFKRYVPTARDNPPILGPAGRVHCSLADWGSFIRANMDPPRPALISPPSLSLLHELVPLPVFDGKRTAYAMGWSSAPDAWAGEPVLSHNGSNGTNFATVQLAPRRGLAFLVATNAGDGRAQEATRRALQALAQRYGANAEAE